ncbi:MAG: hypothetical protein IT377_15310 [Polyangiaceae bacterium]|nr:hypothetical protein [Myxococcales bacterium]MCC6900345.1 hypothetical protein [Polyangiaceae bacterium]
MADLNDDSAPKRPIYLVIALVTLWLSGMTAAAEGFAAIEIVRNPFSSAFSSLRGDAVSNVLSRAFVEGVISVAKRALPVGIAQVILGALLVAISSKALFARRASPWFALQVIAANVAVLIVGYALYQPVRGRVIDAIAESGLEQRPEAISAADFDKLVRLKHWWTFRFRLGLQLAVLGMGALAVTRRSARQVLTHAEPSPSQEG